MRRLREEGLRRYATGGVSLSRSRLRRQSITSRGRQNKVKNMQQHPITRIRSAYSEPDLSNVSNSRDEDPPDQAPGFACYCNQTSLHGWQYLQTEPGLARKVVWALVVLGSVGLAAYFTIANVIEYRNSTVVTSINSTTSSLSDIYFPSIFICNVNQISRAFLYSLDVKIDADAELLVKEFMEGDPKRWINYTNKGVPDPYFVDNNATLNTYLERLKSSYGWNDTVSFANLASQNCSDMIIYSEWKSNVSHSFYDTYQSMTDYGACCLITPYLDFENPATVNLDPALYTGQDFLDVPKGKARNGITNGLKLIIDVEGEKNIFLCWQIIATNLEEAPCRL